MTWVALLLVLGAVQHLSVARGAPWWLVLAGVAFWWLAAWLFQHRMFLVRKQRETLEGRVADAVTATPRQREPADADALVEEMLAQGRYALLLRPQIASNLSEDQRRRAAAALGKHTSLTPYGQLCIGVAGKESDPVDPEEADLPLAGSVVEVDDFHIDRFAVTNRQYQHFVKAGGYTQSALWDVQIWPAVVDFVDRSGLPGPRFWNQGRYLPGEEEHPVVGVSWYEAAAYARWLGKRLPTDVEWEKAGSWPVQLSEALLLQRRYPWGDSMEHERCNVWNSGEHKIVPVTAYAKGASCGGVSQLVGNVWEWTAGDYAAGAYTRRGLQPNTVLKSVRGGAFDTYFDNQATCQFQSGENPIARKHNVGFRCSVSACDLSLPGGGRRQQHDLEDSAPVTAEEAAV